MTTREALVAQARDMLGAFKSTQAVELAIYFEECGLKLHLEMDPEVRWGYLVYLQEPHGPRQQATAVWRRISNSEELAQLISQVEKAHNTWVVHSYQLFVNVRNLPRV